MTYLTRSLIGGVVLLTVSCAAACQSNPIAASHIEANVPSEQDFDVFMKRDLEQYFREEKKQPVTVDYELLRNGPTQSGTAFPKFYAWVIVKADGVIIEEGAVRVAAMEKKRFGVYEYLSQAEIERDVEKIYRVFPGEVADKIKKKLGK